MNKPCPKVELALKLLTQLLNALITLRSTPTLPPTSLMLTVLLTLITPIMLLACSSAPHNKDTVVPGIFLYNLQVRRPLVVGAKPDADPGEKEYESHPRPNERFDCMSYFELFKEMPLGEIRACLTQLSQNEKPREYFYLLERATAPLLKIEKSDPKKGPPSCLERVLPEIPVPREIFFQSQVDDQVGCYSARVAIRQDESLGLRSFLHPFKVKILLPLKKMPLTDQETLMMLATWSLMPFWDEDRSGIASSPVPIEICRPCYGGKDLLKDGLPLPPLWPQPQR